METRNLSLDILRIMACFGVIMIHTAGSPIYHNMVSTGTLWYNECLILDALSKWSVPVFAMLTGYFMLDPNRELPIRTLFSKYILRLVAALIVWSIFYAATLHAPYYPFGSQEGHFWYVGMCISLYLAMPIMRLIARDRKILGYFCWVWLGVKIYHFIGNYVTLPIDMFEHLFVDFVGYCLWAYYLKAVNLSKRNRAIIYGAGVSGMVVTIITALISQNDDTLFFSYTSPNVIITSVALFLFFSNWHISAGEKITKFLTTISKCTFGIYMVHMWILIQIFFRMHRYVSDPMLLCIICVILAFIAGLGITVLIKKIPILNKYIV